MLKRSVFLSFFVLGCTLGVVNHASANENATTASSVKLPDIVEKVEQFVHSENLPNLIEKGVNSFSQRLMWMNKRRKFVLPKGTILTLAPKITLPVFRNQPYDGGLNSDIQASWYFYMYFDKLGMTSDEHPWPIRMPPFYPFGNLMTRRHKQMDKKEEDEEHDEEEEAKRGMKMFPNVIKYHQQHHRQRRSVLSLPPPENIHGGERAVMMPRIEGLLSSLGMEGRSCLLRAICEIHEYPLEQGYGFFGELITLFFSISRSEYAESHMPEYLKAEQAGKAGECSAYFKECRKSIFQWEEKNKYTEEMQNEIPTQKHFNTEEARQFGKTHRS